MDQVEALHSLASELKKAKLTAEEAKFGLKMVQSLEKLGIKQEDYNGVLQACTKMKSEGFINSAVKLNKLENSTGMTYEKIVAKAASTYQELKQTEEDLQTVAGKLKASKEELANIEKQKKLASQGLETHMKNVGVDMKRLKMVENLALVLKKAGEDDKQLGNYIQRQQQLNEAGIALGVFVEILEKAKVLTSHDQGKGLLKSLSDYGGISEAIKDLQAEVALLKKQAAGLEQLAQQKGKLIAEIAELKAEKVSLQSSIAEFHIQKDKLDHIQSELASLTNRKTELEQGIAAQEAYDSALTSEIKAKQQKVSDLKQLEVKHDTLLASVSEIEAKLGYEKSRLKVFESFLGFVNSASIGVLEKFVADLPALLDKAKQGQYSTQVLRTYIFDNLTSNTLQVLKCPSCGVRFGVDQPPMSYGGYHCPCCYSMSVVTDQEGLAILKEALTKVKPQVIVVQPIAKQPKPNPPHGDKSGG